MFQRAGQSLVQSATDLEIDLNIVEVGVPTALAGQLDLPAGVILRTPLAGGTCSAGVAGTSKTREIKVKVKQQ